MLFLYGMRTTRIKKFKTEELCCDHCGHYDTTVKVYESYYYVFYIPIKPLGLKSVKMECNNCGQPVRKYQKEKDYERTIKAPFYLYTGIILLGLLLCALIYLIVSGEQQRKIYIKSPEVGDIYIFQEKELQDDIYYFRKVVKVNSNTVYTVRNAYTYISSVYELPDDDSFVLKDTTSYPIEQISNLYSNNTIISIKW